MVALSATKNRLLPTAFLLAAGHALIRAMRPALLLAMPRHLAPLAPLLALLALSLLITTPKLTRWYWLILLCAGSVPILGYVVAEAASLCTLTPFWGMLHAQTPKEDAPKLFARVISVGELGCLLVPLACGLLAPSIWQVFAIASLLLLLAGAQRLPYQASGMPELHYIAFVYMVHELVLTMGEYSVYFALAPSPSMLLLMAAASHAAGSVIALTGVRLPNRVKFALPLACCALLPLLSGTSALAMLCLARGLYSGMGYAAYQDLYTSAPPAISQNLRPWLELYGKKGARIAGIALAAWVHF